MRGKAYTLGERKANTNSKKYDTKLRYCNITPLLVEIDSVGFTVSTNSARVFDLTALSWNAKSVIEMKSSNEGITVR